MLGIFILLRIFRAVILDMKIYSRSQPHMKVQIVNTLSILFMAHCILNYQILKMFFCWSSGYIPRHRQISVTYINDLRALDVFALHR